jgi:hypothetical protein
MGRVIEIPWVRGSGGTTNLFWNLRTPALRGGTMRINPGPGFRRRTMVFSDAGVSH